MPASALLRNRKRTGPVTMDYYFAPMEGLTGYIFRNAHHALFPHDIKKYFSPFIATKQIRSFTTREIRDILPENNVGVPLVPQLLTNQAKDFIRSACEIERFGYDEINLNLGCPSGTVASKFKGAGFLAKRAELDDFFDEIFSAQLPRISVKTRIGRDEPDEFFALIEIFNRYPIAELIVHPRTQQDYYRNTPNLEMFGQALARSKNPVCYNGDLFTAKDCNIFTAAFPSVGTLMLGRGLLVNPGLVSEMERHTMLEKSRVMAFHDMIYEGYRRTIHGDRNVLFAMKELWSYLIRLFPDAAKYAKRIKKSERLSDYEDVVADLFREREIVQNDLLF